MRALALIFFFAGCANSEGPLRSYDNNDVELAVGNAARMSCSCLFVMKMPEDFCRAWVRASPNVAKYTVDTEARTVEATALLSWGARAHYVDDRRGCVLE
jgi:hypothetical protein